MDYATLEDGCRIAWRMDGPEGAPVLILAHALGASLDMWEPQVEALQGRLRLLRYDARGHGGSDVPPGPYSIERLGRDTLGLMDALGIEKASFCGISMGGFVGQWLGVNAPERLEKLILANTCAYMGPPENWLSRIEAVTTQGVAALAEATLGRWFTPAFHERAPETVESIRRLLLATNPQGYAGCAAAIAEMDLRDILPGITAPTLVIGGSKDSSTPLDCAEMLYAEIADSRLEVLPSAHLSNVEDAAAFNSLLLAFLGE
ncbi:3-oxoadipate enol-lactonase [Pedomonas mirosovicensis]|uniref:3-oxoadipate enol-lactonase n=1 Tax=Pedomonas mirosovicensis TaxID=2908641 RepID=UPI00216817EA|nr:3-oxoadipate enol-lactonase [Pedomonas mirosovicensis]MCH8686432.1 3-oxoadipate enol-lactonase [Pedomonas mirosovicensis]